MMFGDEFHKIATRFSGFSLERRTEWKHGPWRVRILPNKQERQDFRIEVYGETADAAMEKAAEALKIADKGER